MKMDIRWAVVLATILVTAQLGDQSIIHQKTDGVEETAVEWFRKLPNAERGFINLHFYIHDTFTGPNATAYQVAKASITDKSPVGFGNVMVFDVPLLDGPDLSTATVIGHGQGINARVAFDEETPLLGCSFLFKNATLSVFGRIKQDSGVQEIPVVGGTGVFRGAHGTATLTTVSEEPHILDCNLYFVYYP